jgi:hypothetical protein
MGFHLVDAFPKGRALNIWYYRDNSHTALIPLRSQVDRRKLVIHVDNVRPHTAQQCRTFRIENGLRLATHRPYSQYSIFCSSNMSSIVCREYFFDHRKRGLNQLETLHDMFEHCTERIEWIFQKNVVNTIHKLKIGSFSFL